MSDYSDSEWQDINSEDSMSDTELQLDIESSIPSTSRRSSISHAPEREGWEGLKEEEAADSTTDSTTDTVTPDDVERRLMEQLDINMVGTLNASRTSGIAESVPRGMRLSFPDPLAAETPDVNFQLGGSAAEALLLGESAQEPQILPLPTLAPIPDTITPSFFVDDLEKEPTSSAQTHISPVQLPCETKGVVVPHIQLLYVKRLNKGHIMTILTLLSLTFGLATHKLFPSSSSSPSGSSSSTRPTRTLSVFTCSTNATAVEVPRTTTDLIVPSIRGFAVSLIHPVGKALSLIPPANPTISTQIMHDAIMRPSMQKDIIVRSKGAMLLSRVFTMRERLRSRHNRARRNARQMKAVGTLLISSSSTTASKKLAAVTHSLIHNVGRVVSVNPYYNLGQSFVASARKGAGAARERAQALKSGVGRSRRQRDVTIAQAGTCHGQVV